MFGLGKSSTKQKKRSSSSIPWKQWMLNHVEKVAMGLFIMFTGYIVFDGLTTKTYDKSKTPEDLQSTTLVTLGKIEKDNHWPEIAKDRPKPNDFVKQVDDARKPVDPTAYPIVSIPERTPGHNSSEKRGDPELFAPIEVQGYSFLGAIAMNSAKPAPADALLNAPAVGDGRKPRKAPTSATPQRLLNPFFDLGFQYKPGTSLSASPLAPTPTPATMKLVRPVETKAVPAIRIFNILTAAVPHERMVGTYRKELESASSPNADRDSPNYLSYEVQRVDVTDNPQRNIDEAEWQEAKGCTFDRQEKEKATWAGVCEEVSLASYTVSQVFTSPIPPILLSDYRSIASHPLIPRLDVVRNLSHDLGMDRSMERGRPMDDMLESKTNSVGTGKDEGFGSNPVAVEDPQNIPKALEPTEYKLLRFSDFDVSINRIYCYRVRLALEDPNYTRSKNLSPRTADLKPEAVTRVQALETSDGEAMNNLEAGVKFVRNSKRYTPWSQASTPIATRQPIELYSSQTIGTWTQMKTPNGKSDVVVESLPTMTKIVYAEWSQDLAMLIPRKTEVQRGALLSGTATEGLDAIHPISKAIKWVAGFKFSNPVTVVDIRGGLPLAASRKNEKDLLASGGEVVAFDPRTGELIISREFETLTQYQMLGFTDETSQ